jgi:hypothetical protein
MLARNLPENYLEPWFKRTWRVLPELVLEPNRLFPVTCAQLLPKPAFMIAAKLIVGGADWKTVPSKASFQGFN